LFSGLTALSLVQDALADPETQGERLSLNFQNIEVRAALHALAEFSEQNMVISDSVTGQINLRLHDVSWRQALELILRARGLEQQVNDGVIHIGRADEWLANDKQRFEAEQQRRVLQPSGAASFTLRHRQAEDIKKLLDEGRLLTERGALTVDSSTNTLLLNDTPDTAARIRELLAQIDTPVKQVMIEARIVEANDHFSRHLGVKLGFARVRDLSPWTTEKLGQGLPTSTSTGDIAAGVNLPAVRPFGTISALFRPSASSLIALELQAMQTEDQGQVISSPRLLTADQTEATIEEGSEIPYPLKSRRGITSTAFKKAMLSLKVKPQVAPDNKSLWLEIEISKDSPNFNQHIDGAPTVDSKRIRTRVRVENGGTVVLGGIYIDEQSQGMSKVPLLGDAPLIGFLFRSKQNRQQRRELLVFITPRVISVPDSPDS
jgi:type IV pilus assembly protein PilQ